MNVHGRDVRVDANREALITGSLPSLACCLSATLLLQCIFQRSFTQIGLRCCLVRRAFVLSLALSLSLSLSLSFSLSHHAHVTISDVGPFAFDILLRNNANALDVRLIASEKNYLVCR